MATNLDLAKNNDIVELDDESERNSHGDAEKDLHERWNSNRLLRKQLRNPLSCKSRRVAAVAATDVLQIFPNIMRKQHFKMGAEYNASCCCYFGCYV